MFKINRWQSEAS